ncbi:MAG: putative metalloprotease CJM1_0395 family protein [Planctomycetota bacterium]|nr:putative metalloprotease CJM1_0395 family protein [Planctomycetota bacterium]
MQIQASYAPAFWHHRTSILPAVKTSQTKLLGRGLTPEEQQELEKLKARDAEVRKHENDHHRRAGRYARSTPQYEYQRGPDGKQYAVGGHVKIDVSPVPDDPKATIEKMKVIKEAAEAPEKPSAQDKTVARKAEQIEAEARKELAEENREKLGLGGTEKGNATAYAGTGDPVTTYNSLGNLASAGSPAFIDIIA